MTCPEEEPFSCFARMKVRISLPKIEKLAFQVKGVDIFT
jgi:hypothetical protein